jgi:hypothetical protein
MSQKPGKASGPISLPWKRVEWTFSTICEISPEHILGALERTHPKKDQFFCLDKKPCK